MTLPAEFVEYYGHVGVVTLNCDDSPSFLSVMDTPES
jgi:hypothetical protein